MFLQDVWTYYFHDPEDSNWNHDSYIRLGDVCSAEDFWEYHAATAKYINRGMFFVMREHVYPCWDDKYNITGGCMSMKVLKDDLPAFWEHLLVHMLGERLLLHNTEDDDGGDTWSVINGISVSPKRCFCIVKLWLRNERFTDKRAFRLPDSYSGEVLYRTNTENIKGNNEAIARGSGIRLCAEPSK